VKPTALLLSGFIFISFSTAHVHSSRNGISANDDRVQGAESIKDRIMAMTKIVLKLMKQNGC
jgi:hypothetical protein